MRSCAAPLPHPSSHACAQELTPRDLAAATNLAAALQAAEPAWAAEVRLMASTGTKAELEAALAPRGGASTFSGLVEAALLAGDHV